MKFQNLQINHQNGAKNYIIPKTLMPGIGKRLWAKLCGIVPEPKIVYDIYFKATFFSQIEIKKGNVYLDKASGVKLIVLSATNLGKSNKLTAQFCTLLPEKEKTRINVPLYLKYIGTTKL